MSNIVEDTELKEEDVEDTPKNTSSPLSAFEARLRKHDQAMQGLSPMDEMKLAESEFLAQKVIHSNGSHSNFKKKKKTEIDPLNPIIIKSKFANKWHGKLKKSMSMKPSDKTDELKRFIETAKNEELSSYQNFINAQSIKPKWIIHPHSRFRLIWDLLSICLILYNALYIPFVLSYDSTDMNNESESLVEIMIDIFFIVDIFLNFFSAYEKDGHIEFSKIIIMKQYLKTYFFVDLLSAFPFYLLFQSSAVNTPKLAKLLRLIRLIRLFRMFRIARIITRLEYALLIRSTISSLFKFILLVSFSSHWFSCIFFYISHNSDRDEETWTRSNNLHLENVTKLDQYIASYYWSIMTMTTVGFGDVHAMNTTERVFSIFAMVIGAGIFAYGITNVVAMVANLDEKETDFRLKMDKVNLYMKTRLLPVKLRGEIREFYVNSRKSKETNLAREANILKDLSALLRSKIAFAVNDSMIRSMPFFIGAEPNFIMELALRMRMICFAANEVVVHEHEIGEEMFFIFRGAVEVIINDVTITVLGEKQYFGEMAILNDDNKRTATVRTMTFCEFRMLTRQQFLKTLKIFPQMSKRMKAFAVNREKKSSSKLNSEKKNEIIENLEAVNEKKSIKKQSSQNDNDGRIENGGVNDVKHIKEEKIGILSITKELTKLNKGLLINENSTISRLQRTSNYVESQNVISNTDELSKQVLQLFNQQKQLSQNINRLKSKLNQILLHICKDDSKDKLNEQA